MKKTKDLEAMEYKKLPTAGKLFLKATLLSFAITIVMLFITAIGLAIFGFNKFNKFTKMAGTTPSGVVSIVQEALQNEPTQTDHKKNILLLGVDSLDSRPGSPALTDTIMLISLDLQTGTLSTISLPRDLWSEKYKTRINALYFYGQDKTSDDPARFVKETISDLTGIDIHHTVVLSLDAVADIIDILGGVTVDVKHGFIDDKFPNPDVDVTKVSDPTKLYKTVEFKKGIQVMNSQQALEFIRSRKSGDDEGTDNARSSRQQLVIDSLITTIQTLNPLKDTNVLAELYKYYNQNFADQFSIQEAVTTLKTILPNVETIEFSNNSLSVYPENKFGVITNPPTYKYHGEWVYEVIDLDMFRSEIKDKLGIKD